MRIDDTVNEINDENDVNQNIKDKSAFHLFWYNSIFIYIDGVFFVNSLKEKTTRSKHFVPMTGIIPYFLPLCVYHKSNSFERYRCEKSIRSSCHQWANRSVGRSLVRLLCERVKPVICRYSLFSILTSCICDVRCTSTCHIIKYKSFANRNIIVLNFVRATPSNLILNV